MFRPEPMTRTLVVASTGEQRRVIETLYDLRSAHIVEFHEGAEGYEGFDIGKPLDAGSRASELLVRVRALLRHLNLEGHVPSTTYRVDELEEQLDQALVQIESNVTNAVESRQRIEEALRNLSDRIERVRPFADLEPRFADYHGYDNLEVLVGTAPENVEATVRAESAHAEVFQGDDLVAVFVPTEDAEAVNEALITAGFQEVEVPDEEGRPADIVQEARRERERLEARLEDAESRILELRERHGDLLLAAEEHLNIEVEKAEAPLDFASTENAFIVEAWVPSSRVDDVRATLAESVEGDVHVEVLGEAAYHHDEPHDDHADEPAEGEEGAEDHGSDIPPTHYDNPGSVRPFQPFTDLFARPKYDEVDPTLILAITFPLFYGIMIGDAGYGILMMLLGGVMVAKLKDAGTAKALGVAFLVAGAVSFGTGAFVFHDAFGIPFEPHAEAASCHALYEHGESSWTCILGMEEGALHKAHPPVNKLTDVPTLLIFSVLAAFLHLFVGFVFAMVNEYHHSKAHALAQVGWLALATGIIMQILFMARFNRLGGWVWSYLGSPNQLALPIGGLDVHYALIGLGVVGAVILGATEGAIGVIEIPSILSTILSYTRLAGVAVAKAAMAVAFNGLFLSGMILTGGGYIILMGALLLILAQLVVFVLGLLSSGIQAIRLNYVEFFRWFYDGGGDAFDPFGRERTYTEEQPLP